MAEAGETEKPHFHGHRARLRARFLDSGGAGIPDYEILELILFGVFRNGDTKPLAKALVSEFGSLAAVLAAPTERLSKVPGCGEAVIAALKVTREAHLRQRVGRAPVGALPIFGGRTKSFTQECYYCRDNAFSFSTERIRSSPTSSSSAGRSTIRRSIRVKW